MTQLSVDALRLLGRIYRAKKLFTLPALIYEVKQSQRTEGAGRTCPQALAEELTVHGYLTPIWNEEVLSWLRTEKPYTEQLRLRLARLAQREARHRKKPPATTQVNVVRSDISPELARWFGYPQTAVFLTGDIHYLDD
jgi:hypothetical protein